MIIMILIILGQNSREGLDWGQNTVLGCSQRLAWRLWRSAQLMICYISSNAFGPKTSLHSRKVQTDLLWSKNVTHSQGAPTDLLRPKTSRHEQGDPTDPLDV